MNDEAKKDVYEDEAMIAEDPEEEGKGDEGESKADRFTRLALIRVNNALKQIDNIGKLSSPAYEYTDEQIDKIEAALTQSVTDAISKFRKEKKETKFSF